MTDEWTEPARADSATHCAPPFVGRARELSVLRAALADARDGRGRLVLLAGEPGIGKTRTAEEVAAHARQQGMQVLWGRCYEGEGAPAFWPWVQLLRTACRRLPDDALRIVLGWGGAEIAQLIPELRQRLPDLSAAPAPESAQARFRLFESVAGFLENLSRQSPLVCIVDDLHGGDRSSLLLGEFVSRELRDVRTLLVGTYRDGAALIGHPLSELVVEALRLPGAQRLTLSGLSLEEVADLLERASGVRPAEAMVAAVHQQTEGNPLFVGEYVRLLLARHEPSALSDPQALRALPVPESVRVVVRHRVAPLSATCRAALGVAAVIGREFHRDVVEMVVVGDAGVAADARVSSSLDEAAVAGIVGGGLERDGRYRFAHAVMREALYEDLGSRQRQQLHRRVGEVLEQGRDADEHLAELAYHFSQAATGADPVGVEVDAAKAVAYARRAGDRAMDSRAYEEAIRLYQLALAGCGPGAAAARVRCAVLVALGAAQNAGGDLSAGKATLASAATLAEQLGMREEQPTTDEGLLSDCGTVGSMRQVRDGGDDQVVLDARRAGDAALQTSAFEEAARLYGAALDALDRRGTSGTRVQMELLLARGDAQRRAGEIAPAKQAFMHAAECARALDDREFLSLAALGYGGELAFPEGGYRDDFHLALLAEAIAAWGSDDHQLHARLLGHLATCLYFTDAAPVRAELCERAVSMARRLGEPRTLAQVLLAEHVATWGPNPRERLAIDDELLRLASRLADRALAYSAHQWRLCDALDLADRAVVDNELLACRNLAAELDQPAQTAWAAFFGVMLDTLEGRFDAAERAAGETLARGQWLGRVVEPIFGIQLSVLRYLQGRIEEVIDPIRAMVALHPGIMATRAGLAAFCAEAGRHTEALAEAAPLVDAIDDIPWDLNLLPTLAHLGHACARAGDTSRAASVHERLRAYDGLSVTLGHATGYFGAVAYYLGMIEAALARHDDACRHFEEALVTYESLRAQPWTALAQYEYGALLAGGKSVDRETASRLLGDAYKTARELGMTSLQEKISRLLDRTQPSAISDRAFAATNQKPETRDRLEINLFRREGDYWTITYDGRVLRLKDSRGLHYLAHLLRHPEREFHVLEILGVHGQGDGAQSTGANEVRRDDGPGALDAAAKAAYRQRLDELRGELEEAERFNDSGRVARLRHEHDAIAEQLVAAVGLGGRDRRAGSSAERARSTVGKRIKDVLKKLRQGHPALGHHLATSIKTGYFCSYQPNATQAVRWTFADAP